MGCNHQIGDSECEHHHTYLEFLLAVSYNWLQYQTPFFRRDCIFHHSDQKVYFRAKIQYSNLDPIWHENIYFFIIECFESALWQLFLNQN